MNPGPFLKLKSQHSHLINPMKKFVRKYILLGLLFLVVGINSLLGQTVPVGMPQLDQYLRRAQLLGLVDSSSSFMIRPIYPTEAFGFKNGFDLDSSVVDMDLSKVHRYFGEDKKGKFLVIK